MEGTSMSAASGSMGDLVRGLMSADQIPFLTAYRQIDDCGLSLRRESPMV